MHTQAQIYTFSHASPSFFFFFFWRPHPLFLFFRTHKWYAHPHINTHTATMIPAHGTDAQFVWFSRKQGNLGQAWIKICHNCSPVLTRAKAGVLCPWQFPLWLPPAVCRSMKTRPGTLCDKALHNQSSPHMSCKGKRQCFYLELAPAITYITPHYQMCLTETVCRTQEFEIKYVYRSADVF